MEHHVIDAFTLRINMLSAPDGKPLPVIELTLMTRPDADQAQLTQWPTLRLRPRDTREVIEKLTEALQRVESQDYAGPGRIQ